MGDSRNVDPQQMRRDLIASATADPSAFVDRVMANFDSLTERISRADAEIVRLTKESEDKAALITDLSLQKDQAVREAEQILSRARQEAAEIISDAKSEAKQLTGAAETKLVNANLEADSIKTTKLNAIRNDIAVLENQRTSERDQTLGFLRTIGAEYDGIIEQCSQTLSKLRTTRTYVMDQANAVESTDYEHFDIGQYLPKHTYQSVASQAEEPQSTQPVAQPTAQVAAPQEPIVSVPPMPATPQQPAYEPVQQVAQQVPQQVQQLAVPVQQPVQQQYESQPQYVDSDGIMPTEHSFNDLFQMGGQPVAEEEDDFGSDDYAPVDEFGDSGLLMEAMSGLEDDQDDFAVTDPSDSGLLMDALSSIDDVEEQRENAEFAEMDEFDDFDDEMAATPADPQPAPQPRVRVPQRKRGSRNRSTGWGR